MQAPFASKRVFLTFKNVMKYHLTAFKNVIICVLGLRYELFKKKN